MWLVKEREYFGVLGGRLLLVAREEVLRSFWKQIQVWSLICFQQKNDSKSQGTGEPKDDNPTASLGAHRW